jgi:hypothetical protein
VRPVARRWLATADPSAQPPPPASTSPVTLGRAVSVRVESLSAAPAAFAKVNVTASESPSAAARVRMACFSGWFFRRVVKVASEIGRVFVRQS